MVFTTIKRGVPNSTSYRIFIKDEKSAISALHDIPLYADKGKSIYNMIILSPRWSNAKMKMSMTEPLNPIMQEENNGHLSYVPNYFPHHGYIWNYGVFPQASRIPSETKKESPAQSMLENIEVIEIGYRIGEIGEVIQVKILGSINLKGGKRAKIVAINVNDPLAPKLHILYDIIEYFPGLLKATMNWLENQTSPENYGAVADVQHVYLIERILKELHKYWAVFLKKPTISKNLSIVHVRGFKGSTEIKRSEAEAIIGATPPLGKPLAISNEVNAWLFGHIKTELR